ncbi:MAG: Nramp family divalent metal transporter [Armatimonadota bacterium]
MSNLNVVANKLRHAKIFQYLGPGLIVTVGFIDPGNFATNAAGGASFGYSLLWVITLSTLMLILLQHMAEHLGIQTGRCMPEAIATHFSRPAKAVIGVTAMLACVATALAEVLGAAIGLNILWHVPLVIGATVTGAIVVALIWSQVYRRLESIIIGFVSIIGFCYLAEVIIVRPDWSQAVLGSFTPSLSSRSILIAMAMLGAVVMPHNIFLHSEIIQSRDWSARDEKEREQLMRFEFLDTLLSMGAGWLINSAMIIVAAAVFFKAGVQVSELPQVAQTLTPLAGPLAGLLFAVALLCSGISSSITAGLAGGTCFSGFIGKETEFGDKWFRIGVTLTLVPAVLIVALGFNPMRALILSQAALSLQLPFTIIPLYLLTRSEKVMGRFRNTWRENALLLVTAFIVIGLNAALLYQTFGGKF